MKNVLMMLLLVTLGWAQEKPKEPKKEVLPVISAEDRANYLEADREFVKAVAALSATPQYQAAQAAQQKRQQAIGALFAKYKVAPTTPLCDGPGAPPCADVAAGELVFREASKKEEGKK